MKKFAFISVFAVLAVFATSCHTSPKAVEDEVVSDSLQAVDSTLKTNTTTVPDTMVHDIVEVSEE